MRWDFFFSKGERRGQEMEAHSVLSTVCGVNYGCGLIIDSSSVVQSSKGTLLHYAWASQCSTHTHTHTHAHTHRHTHTHKHAHAHTHVTHTHTHNTHRHFQEIPGGNTSHIADAIARLQYYCLTQCLRNSNTPQF